MDRFELAAVITRVAIWLAVAGWAFVVAGLPRGGEARGRRRVWTAALVAYLCHVAAAFEAHYGWSHEVAWRETARQTEDLAGIGTGFGLWLNYLVGVFWIIDTGRWWLTGKIRPDGRSRRLWWAWHLFLAFMIFNGTVVFGHGPVRWFGAAFFVSLAALWLRAKVRAEN